MRRQGVQRDKRDAVDRIRACLRLIPALQFASDAMDEKRYVDNVAAVLDSISHIQQTAELYDEASFFFHFTEKAMLYRLTELKRAAWE
jgi:hypothetical protein